MSGFLVNKSLLDPTVTQYSGGTAAFTLPQSGSTNATEVFVGGVPQVAGVDFNVSGTALTLTTSAPAGSNMVCARQYFSDGITGTPASNSVASSAIQAGAVTAAKLDGSAAASTTDMRLAFLMIAENQGDRLNMDDGIADPLKDETDIDTSTSTNETYDASGDYYTSMGADTAIDASGLTEVGGIGAVSRTGAKYDGNLDQSYSASTLWNLDATEFAFGIDHGSGVTRVIKALKYTSTNDANGGFFAAASGGNLTWKAQGSTDSTNWVDLGGNLTADAPYADTSVTIDHGPLTSTTAYRYHRVHVTKNSGSAGYLRLCEARWMIAGAAVNMTLVSNAFTATAVPATGRIHIQVNPVDAITINTDLTAEISRDGGTTWSTATLVLKETLKDGTVAYEDNSVTISGQPSGTSMKYRIKTLNTKQVQVHGVVFQWSA